MKLGIFTKPIHVEKIVNYLNQYTDVDYVISTNKHEIESFEFDIGISYSFPFIIDINGKPWYNYHPAPPEYPGMTNYSKPVRNKVKSFAVILHKMTEIPDDGPLLKVKEFELDSIPVNSNELGNITHYYLFQLFKETIEKLAEGDLK